MSTQKKRKWSIFFLLKAIGPSTVDAISMLNDFRKIDFGSNNDLGIVFCLNVFKRNVPAILSGDPNEISNEDDKTQTTIFCSLVKSDDNANGFLNDLDIIYEQVDFDLSNPEHVGKFFRQQVLEKFLAERYMILTWDHGNGYGIFSDSQPLGESAVLEEKDLNSFITTSRKSRFFSHTSNKIKDGSSESRELTMDELAFAIKNAFGDQKIDLMVMMNCYMQFMDAGYALRERVKYLVAPQTFMDFDGYNYTFFFRKLKEQPDLSSLKLAKIIVRSFETKLYPDYLDGVLARSTTAIFANDLTYYSTLADYIDELSRAMGKQLVDQRLELLMARSNTIPVNGNTHSIDLFNLLRNLQKVFGKKWETGLISRLFLLRKQMVVEKFVGSAYADGVETASPSGLSVFFPVRLQPLVNTVKLDVFNESSFTKERNWNKFVLQFT